MWEALGEYQGPPFAKAFVRYSMAKYLRHVEDMSYRTYVTDSLRLVPQMMYISRRWSDVIDKAKNPQPERDANEIIDDVIDRLKG